MTFVSMKPTATTSYSCAYGELDIGDKSPNDLLEITSGSYLRSFSATVVNRKRLSVQGYPALEVQALAGASSTLDVRFVFTGRRLYLISAYSTQGPDRDPGAIHRLFDSFKVVRP